MTLQVSEMGLPTRTWHVSRRGREAAPAQPLEPELDEFSSPMNSPPTLAMNEI